MGKSQWNIITLNKEFYSHLNLDYITYTDYAHARKVCKDFEIKKSYWVQSNTLLLADIFENFPYIFLEIYELHPATFLCTPELAWQAALNKTKVK